MVMDEYKRKLAKDLDRYAPNELVGPVETMEKQTMRMTKQREQSKEVE
jgi:hypothetical protein